MSGKGDTTIGIGCDSDDDAGDEAALEAIPGRPIGGPMRGGGAILTAGFSVRPEDEVGRLGDAMTGLAGGAGAAVTGAAAAGDGLAGTFLR